MTMLDDDAVDLRLRRASERLRAEAPDGAEIDAALARLATRPVTPARRAPWVVPVTIGAVAAAVVGLIVVTAISDETAPTPPLDTPVASTATIPERPLRVFDENFDDDGGECYEFEDVVGCVPGVQRRTGRPFAATSSDGSVLLLGNRAIEATLPSAQSSCLGGGSIWWSAGVVRWSACWAPRRRAGRSGSSGTPPANRSGSS